MPVIVFKTVVDAPIERCFDVSRDIGIHTQTVWKHTREKAVSGVTTGLIEAGQTVTFEATHFGVRQRLTSKIVEYDRPFYFVDEMQKGAFHSLRHEHIFVEQPEGTLMTDIMDYKSPLGFLGRIFDYFVLERYMYRFIRHRSLELKKLLEQHHRLGSVHTDPVIMAQD